MHDDVEPTRTASALAVIVRCPIGALTSNNFAGTAARTVAFPSAIMSGAGRGSGTRTSAVERCLNAPVGPARYLTIRYDVRLTHAS